MTDEKIEAAQDEWALPGMEDVVNRAVAPLEVAVRRTITRLQELGHIEEMHAAHLAAAIELAQVINKKHTTGRMSTIGNDMKAMIDLLDRLVPASDNGVDLQLKAAMEEWSKQLAAAEQTTPEPTPAKRKPAPRKKPAAKRPK